MKMKLKLSIFVLLLATQLYAGKLIVRGVIGNSGIAGETLIKTRSDLTVRSGLTWSGKHFWFLGARNRLIKLDTKGKLVESFEIPGLDQAETGIVQLATVNEHVFALFKSNKKLVVIPNTARTGEKVNQFYLANDIDWSQSVSIGNLGVNNKLIIGNGTDLCYVEIPKELSPAEAGQLTIPPKAPEVKKEEEKKPQAEVKKTKDDDDWGDAPKIETVVIVEPVPAPVAKPNRKLDILTRICNVPSQLAHEGVSITTGGLIYLTTVTSSHAYNIAGTEIHKGDKIPTPLFATERHVFGCDNGRVVVTTPTLKKPRFLGGTSQPELGKISQIVELDSTTIAAIGLLGKIYIGEVKENTVTWARRYGSVRPSAIGVNSEGHIFSSIRSNKPYYGGLMAWNWRSEALDAPDFVLVTENALAYRQLFADADGSTWGITDKSNSFANTLTLWRFPLIDGQMRYLSLSGKRPPSPTAMCRVNNVLLLVSNDGPHVYKCKVPGLGETETEVRVADWSSKNPLRNPNQITGWTKGRFLIADGNTIHMLRYNETKIDTEWEMTSWGSDQFGDELYIAADGDHLFVSDTQHHRVLVFSISTQKKVAQLGVDDEAGSSDRLDSPKYISASNNRVIVYDSGNERILKLKFQR